MESTYYANDKKLKINLSPIMNNILKIKPEEKKIVKKHIYNLKNNNEENDLMIIKILSCKGYFVYVLKDFPPLDNDIYQNLKLKSIPSEMYSSNGKK